ncbi:MULTISPECIES: hypothetical protein [Burkholderia]|uniref:hypothetical protein n=1 Tax=Burkholderia TaxID=32008 RepID=UPI001B916B97|nr:hypothetical protein [Burkholderia vietnamiensis]MBR8001843.1 hypothetical protein [Burkholderia vietnamiensis]
MATKEKSMKKSNMRTKVRISARIDQTTYIAARILYGFQGISIEKRIQEFLSRDIKQVSQQKWFVDLLKSEGAGDLQSVINAFSSAKNAPTSPDDDMSSYQSDHAGDSDNEEVAE